MSEIKWSIVLDIDMYEREADMNIHVSPDLKRTDSWGLELVAVGLLGFFAAAATPETERVAAHSTLRSFILLLRDNNLLLVDNGCVAMQFAICT